MMKKIIFIILMLMSQYSLASIFYVSKDGNDENNGTSTESPFLTITEAVGSNITDDTGNVNVVGGDTVIVGWGTYDEVIAPHKSKEGTELNKTTLIGSARFSVSAKKFYPNASDSVWGVKIRNTNVTGATSCGVWASHEDSVTNFHIIGFDIGKQYGKSISIDINNDGWIFQQCRIREHTSTAVGNYYVTTIMSSVKFISCLFDGEEDNTTMLMCFFTGYQGAGSQSKAIERVDLINCTFNGYYDYQPITIAEGNLTIPDTLIMKNCIVQCDDGQNGGSLISLEPDDLTNYEFDYNLWHRDKGAKWYISDSYVTSIESYRSALQSNGANVYGTNDSYSSFIIDSNGVLSSPITGINLGYGLDIGYFQAESSSSKRQVIIF